jgi:hypothetical protein
MNDNPCQKLQHEFKQATLEFLEANNLVISFSKSPMFQGKDIKMSSEHQEQLSNAIKRLELARERLSCINKELVKCQKENRG